MSLMVFSIDNVYECGRLVDLNFSSPLTNYPLSRLQFR